jgi:hypothetical protein
MFDRLAAHETRAFVGRWPRTDTAGVSVPAGRYVLSAYFRGDTLLWLGEIPVMLSDDCIAS